MPNPSHDEVNEVFIVYSSDPGAMPVDHIGPALRGLGFNPSEVDIQVQHRKSPNKALTKT